MTLNKLSLKFSCVPLVLHRLAFVSAGRATGPGALADVFFLLRSGRVVASLIEMQPEITGNTCVLTAAGGPAQPVDV